MDTDFFVETKYFWRHKKIDGFKGSILQNGWISPYRVQTTCACFFDSMGWNIAQQNASFPFSLHRTRLKRFMILYYYDVVFCSQCLMVRYLVYFLFLLSVVPELLVTVREIAVKLLCLNTAYL